MDPEMAFAGGNAAFVDECYDEAVKAYTVAIEANQDSRYFLNRAAAHLKLGNFTEAVEDSNQALTLDSASKLAFWRKGQALFQLDEYEAARSSFLKGQRLVGQEEEGKWKAWVRKCDAESSGSSLPLRAVNTAAPPSTTASSAAPKTGTTVRPLPEKEAPPAPTPALAPAPTPAAAPAPAPTPISSSSAAPPKDTSISGRPKIRHEWVQSSTSVSVVIYVKGMTADRCKVTYQPRSFSAILALPDSPSGAEEWALETDELFDEIDPSQSKFNVSAVKVELVMSKKHQGVHWSALEASAAVVKDAPPLVYPSSKAKKKDWGEIEREMEMELKKEKPQGEEALNHLFREIYSKANEDTRRAMIKSFQTSGGTVLSTNWDEVGKADYEKTKSAPDGQQWKKWEV